MLDLLIVGIYFAAMLLVGAYVYGKGRASRSDSFFVADRRGSRLLLTGSLFATIVGASATVGLAGWGFTRGLTGAWWLLVGTLGLLALSLFWAKRVRSFGLYTLPEVVERQYGRGAGFLASVLIVVSWIGIIAAQIVAAGKILGVLVSDSSTMLMVIAALVFILYTLLGAQYSILRTDFVQSAILILGIVATLSLVLSRVGGLDGLRGGLPADHFSFPVSTAFGWSDLLSLVVLVGATYVVGPDIYSRLFCARDEKVARSSALWAGLAIVPLAFFIALIGMGARVLFPGISSEQAFPAVIQDVLPVGLCGLVIAALLAAIMSSADTCLLTTSTILTEDVCRRVFPNLGERARLRVSRLGMVVVGTLALLIALKLGGVISSLLMAYTIFTSGIVLPVLAGLHREKLKVNSAGAMAAIAGGGGTALVVKLLGADDFQLLGIGVCAVLLFGVSWVTGRRGLTSVMEQHGTAACIEDQDRKQS